MSTLPLLAIDIGGTAIKSALLTQAGQWVASFDPVKTPYSKEGLEEALAGRIRAAERELAGVAISTTGIIDADSGAFRRSGSFPFMVGQSFKAGIEGAFGLPTWVVNDGQAALYGELWQGKLAGVDDGILVAIGTGLVAGFVLGGRPYFGAHGQAGELSSVTQDEHEGYFPVRLSGVHFIHRANALLGRPKEADGAAVFAVLDQGHAQLEALFQEYCHDLALLLFNLEVTLDPSLIVLSGGICQQERFIEEVRAQHARIYAAKSEAVLGPSKLRLTRSALQGRANLAGAVYYFNQRQAGRDPAAR